MIDGRPLVQSTTLRIASKPAATEICGCTRTATVGFKDNVCSEALIAASRPSQSSGQVIPMPNVE